MTLSEMKERKRELGYSYEQIADWSGVPLSTVQKLFGGVTKSPRYDTLRAIEEVLMDRPATAVREATVQYGRPIEKKQGEYTVADYYAWPEDERIELIDGVIYDMGAPSFAHQDIIIEIAYVLKKYIKENKGNCKVCVAPLDVQLDCDNKTMIQPDIMVICKKDIITKKNLFGAPDMIVEVLSKSTRKKDMGTKLAKYIEANVREYWIVDLEKERVIVYDIENDIQTTIFTFENKVPVGIWGDECVVDFAEIKAYLEE
ncbi:MAG: Uma2 family endonuclease [Agathobacter sp.]|nr:Uma2 family endonuclease [Agathobacter sp.]